MGRCPAVKFTRYNSRGVELNTHTVEMLDTVSLEGRDEYIQEQLTWFVSQRGLMVGPGDTIKIEDV